MGNTEKIEVRVDLNPKTGLELDVASWVHGGTLPAAATIIDRAMGCDT